MVQHPIQSDPPEPLLFDFIKANAAIGPDSTAVRYAGRAFTWAQWRDRILRLAHRLSEAGIHRGCRVAFIDKNHPACLETLFATATMGATTTVVNWRLADNELRFVLNDSEAHLVIAGAEFAPRISEMAESIPRVQKVVVVGGDTDSYEQWLAEAARPSAATSGVRPDDDALIIYSSGTTGKPKGVVLGQRALIAHTVNAGSAFPFTDGDTNLVAMPLFHVGGTSYALFGIRAGVPTELIREPNVANLTQAVSNGATHAFLVPPVISSLLEADGNAAAAMAGLRYVGYGAAPMPQPILRRALQAWPDTNFVQIFGQSEIAGAATTLTPQDHRDTLQPQLLTSVGRPIPGVAVKIVDPDSSLDVPAEQSGEVWVHTCHRMSRYLNLPEASAHTITPDGWIRTGDIGRIDTRGYLYIVDRLKDMIITGGENVYGAEVERALLSHPAIVDAAVIGVPDEYWGESVKALVVCHTPIDEASVIAHCRQQLAGYKCPRTVDFVAELPRNASGKVLKYALREPFLKEFAARTAEHDPS